MFIISKFTFKRQDTDDVWRKILNVSYAEWQKMGFSKNTGNKRCYLPPMQATFHHHNSWDV